MNLLSLAHYTVLLINIWLIFFVLSKNLKALLNWVCVLLLSCISVWNLAFTFFQASVSHDNAMLWLNISSFGWCSIAIFTLWLALIVTGKEKILKKWYFYFIIFSIAAVIIYKQWTGYLIHDVAKQSYGWSHVWSKSIWPWIFYIYYCSIITAALYFGYKAIKTRKYLYEMKRNKLTVFIGFSFFISASVIDVVLPQVNINIIPPIGSIISVILACAFVYEITKYGFMTLTPAYAASDILATMSDSLILISPEGNVIEVNNAALSLLAYSKDEIIGSPARKLFKDDSTQFLDEKEESFDKNQIFLHTKNGEDIPVSFSVSKMKDKEGNLLGFVGVARDMREILMLQNREKELAAEKVRAEALQERAQELQEAYDKLKAAQAMLLQSEKMAAVGQLAGGVADENK